MGTPSIRISVTEFKLRCLEIVRNVELTGKCVIITRRGKEVARLDPPLPEPQGEAGQWRLRERSHWLAYPDESFLAERDLKSI